ncbi:zinc finger protein OZF-like [Diorhabda carinulata]|uniref:zinc finger protein OZF-like n=1 Tax=Diorhabda carinulata TaxID=1163345 RepID=UPI0025A0979B|nr:zinc finger protein OZF-like [Diorhabda carinulata]
MDVKQEMIDEVPISNIENINGKVYRMHTIKQKINYDSNKVRKVFNSVDVVRTKRNILYTNNFKHSKVKCRKKTKSPVTELLRNKKCIEPNSKGLMICVYCGNLYTKQVEFLYHISKNHCIKKKNIKLHHKSRNDTCIMGNLDIKDEFEVVEHKLKMELQEITNQFDVTDNNLSSNVHKEGSKSNIYLGTPKRLKPFDCIICPKSFTCKSSLNKHSRIHTGEKLFECVICTKSFPYKISLNKHLVMHTGEKPFKCEICLKTFSHKSNLNTHARSHKGEKPFKCDVCLTTFSHKSNSNTHIMLKHTGEKPYECEICLKTFSKKESLNIHFRRHTGEKPFKCDVCSKTFSQNSGLIAHVRIHTGEKPFKCKICLKSFSDKSNFNVHMRSHTEEHPFKCDVCSKTFLQKIHLITHLRGYIGVKPFKCDICSKNFLHKKSLNKHLNNHK